MEQADTTLLIDGDIVASWTSPHSRVKAVTLALNGTAVSFGTLLKVTGTLTLTVQNEAGKTDSKNIKLTDDAILGLSSLQQLLQVDKEVNLLENLTFAKGIELIKTEIEFEGQRSEIADAMHYTPAYPGPCSLFFTVKRKSTEGKVKAEDLIIKPLDYKAMEISNLKPVDILPII